VKESTTEGAEGYATHRERMSSGSGFEWIYMCVCFHNKERS